MVEILNKNRHWFYVIIGVIGAYLLVWQIDLYRKTLVDFRIPLLIILTSGTIAYSFDRESYKTTYNVILIDVFAWLQNVISWGSIICATLMFLNFYFASPELVKKEYSFIYVSSMSGPKTNRSRRRPLVYIRYDGVKKELIFPHKYLKEFDQYKSVELVTSKGFLGFDVIKNRALKK